jgi:DNA primase
LKWTLSDSLSPTIRANAEEILDDRLAKLKSPASPLLTRQPSRAGQDRNAPTKQRSLVRIAIALLLQQPRLVASMQPPYIFSDLRYPGIPLLMELIALCKQRPDISSGALLEHFAKRDEAKALQKLMVSEFPGGETEHQAEFLDALEQLNRQTLQQRLNDLLQKKSEAGLNDTEKQELRELFANKARVVG